MRVFVPAVRLTLPALLILIAACDGAPPPARILGNGAASSTVTATRGVHVSTNPACTRHWKDTTYTNPGSWSVDTNWVEGTIPDASSIVCISSGAAFIGNNGSFPVTGSATVAAVTITGGELAVVGPGSSLTVAQNVEVFYPGYLGIQGEASSGTTVDIGGTLLIKGTVYSFVAQCAPCATSNTLRANIVADGALPINFAQLQTLFGTHLTLDKIGGSIHLLPGSLLQGGGMLIPASAVGATVDNDGGEIYGGNYGLEMQTGTFTYHSAGLSLINVLLSGANFVYAATDGSTPGLITLNRPPGTTQTVSGDCTCDLTILGSGAGTTSTVQFNDNVTSAHTVYVTPQAGEVVNLTGPGTFTSAYSFQTFVPATAQVHLKLNMTVGKNASAGWTGPTYFDQPGKVLDVIGTLAHNGGPSDPLIAGTGTTVHVESASNTPADLELRGAHLILEENFGGSVINSLGSTVDLGPSFRQVSIHDYQQDATSTLALKVGGLIPGVSHDQINLYAPVTSSTLGGAVSVTTVAPFVGGVCGQLPALLTGNSITGTFASATGLTLAPTRSWGLVYPGTQVLLRGFDPTQKLNLAPNPVAVAEGGAQASYSLCLSTQPTADVNVALSTDAQVNNPFAPGPVQVPAASWWQPLSLYLSAVDDATVEPLIHAGTATHTASSTDPFFNGAVGVLTANVTDNDGNADLALTIPTPPPPLTLNQTFNVGFRDRDIGPTLSTGAAFTVPSSPGFRFVSATGTTCAPSGGNLVCQLAGVASGGQVNFTLTFKAIKRGTFPVTLTLAGQQPDPNASNNVLTRSITVN